MVTGLGKVAADESLDTWKDYLTFHLLDHYSNLLPKAFVDERFAFYGAGLQGTPQLAARWKRGVNSTNAVLGEAVGQAYVAKYFPAQSKAEVSAMVDTMKAAFEKRIDSLDWMAPETKAEAHRKVEVLKVGVGYPDTWRDYSGLTIVRGDALGNVQRSEAFDYATAKAKLGKPVDRGEWVMTPQIVNAVNLPMLNGLNFPAAILQAPNFDPSFDAAANYGAIGATIGHEISHSFDDQGAQFDSQGRLRNWWTPTDFDHFQKAGAALALQFDGYKPFPDLGGERQADPQREHRRRRRPGRGAGRLPRLAGRQAGSGDRRPDRRPAVLPGLRPELAELCAGRLAAPGADHRRPRAGPLPRPDRAQS